MAAINTENDIKALKETIIEVLKTIYDPEVPVNIYEMGLIYEIEVFPVNNVYVKMTLTSPACPVAETLPPEVEAKVKSIPEVNDVTLDLVWDPPWDQTKMSEAAKLELGFM
ncbi:MAG: DUF59 domain-containing protein [Cytophagales bacterium]|nr:DUF59 domain-containing protein [Cytophagales bacterium]